jgi:hypothetical protein
MCSPTHTRVAHRGKEIGDGPATGDDAGGVDISPGDEDEGALVSARMRQLQSLMLHHQISHGQHVDVECARPPSHVAHAAEIEFNRLGSSEVSTMTTALRNTS